MPSKQKINLSTVLASALLAHGVDGCSVPPEKLKRVDSNGVECPECGLKFVPKKTK